MLASLLNTVRISGVLIGLFLSANPLATAADWPMLGRDVARNPVSPERNPPLDWDVETDRNVKWKAQLGSMTHGTPVIADGQVYIGTNNGAGYLKRYPSKVDLGVLLCFREMDGEFLWQYSAEKLPTGRIHDWPTMGIGSSPLVEGERLWFVSNRWEVVCLDTQGFRDGENDEPVTDEVAQSPVEADVAWAFDMMKELGVQPHNQGMGPTRRSSPAAAYKNRLYFVTGNGVDESHINIPTPEAPSLVCLDKNTGEVLWTDNSPGANLLHGQFASPLVAEIAGRAQVIIPQGDGWIRSFDALTGELIWTFDINRKEAKWILGGRGERNHVLGTPVLYENRIYLASGQEAEHGEGPCRLVCLDPTKAGDISAELAVDADGNILPHRRIQAVISEQKERAVPNPNSGLIWEFTSEGEKWEHELHRTMATVAIHDGVLVLPDYSGLVHCFDARTGRRLWYYDCIAPIWSTPLIVDGHVYVGNEDGDVVIFNLETPTDAEAEEGAVERQPLAEFDVGETILASPVFANGTLYVPTRSTLHAIANPAANADAGSRSSHDQPTSTDPSKDPRRIPNATFTPTPQDVVARMLELAAVKQDDVVFDLGSGDGRIVITAAKLYGCRAVGYEIDGQLVKDSQAAAVNAGVDELVTFHRADLFTADLKTANVITLYLLPIQNKRLIPALKMLQPGTRIVTHQFDIPEIAPDKVIHFESQDSAESHRLSLYTVPLTESEPVER